MALERLQKVLASAGVASRRDCEAIIIAGRVKVNGQVVRQLGTRVDPEHDRIRVDGRVIVQPPKRVYILLYKPVGVVSTVDDPEHRPTVLDMVKIRERIFPIGRLDAYSEGLLLLTNDGTLTHYLTHPRFEVEKEYHALLSPVPDYDSLTKWREGILLEGKRTAPAQVEVFKHTPEGSWVRIVMREGRKRQIREIAQLLGYSTRRLIRVREGDVCLGDLEPGQWRHLTPEEVQSLQKYGKHKAIERSNT